MNSFLSLPHPLDADHLLELHDAEFIRLQRALNSAKGFRLLFAQSNQPAYQGTLIERLSAAYPHSAYVSPARAGLDDLHALQRYLGELAQKYRIIHLCDLDNWLRPQRRQWLHGWNAWREKLAQECPCTLLIWLTAPLLKDFALEAPDLWAWRAGVLDFNVQQAVSQPVLPVTREIPAADTPAAEKRRLRIQTIQDYLRQHKPEDALRASLVLEQGTLHQALGEPDAALECFQQARELYRQLRDEIKIAGTYGYIADILFGKGELEEALRIRREEELPVYERLGDVRERAVTMGKIADIMQARGELEEALRIRREEELPVYERLGDVRSLLIGRTNLALLLRQYQGAAAAEEVRDLLCLALRDARKLEIPEARTIAEFLEEFGMEC
ncbi:MAG: aldehyde dehydrogenase [Gammaproteobacteria bacterium]|nr:aldehyde dehydrogenase [Gammaproteobacteria bacterium]